jgi:hypothetical protein
VVEATPLQWVEASTIHLKMGLCHTEPTKVRITRRFSVGLFEFIRLKLYLEELTGRNVDMVTPDALRPTMRAEILQEPVNVS